MDMSLWSSSGGGYDVHIRTSFRCAWMDVDGDVWSWQWEEFNLGFGEFVCLTGMRWVPKWGY